MAAKRKAKAPNEQTPSTSKAAGAQQTNALVQRLRAALGKNGGANIVGMAASASSVREFIPSGLSVIDHHLLGGGGLPVGRLTEMFGDEGTGKTSLVFAFMAGAQRAGGIVGLAETENALQVERATTFGVDTEQVVLSHPDSLEDVLSMAEEFMKALPPGSGPNLWVLDSIAAAATRAEIENGAGGALRVGEFARRMSHGIKQLCALAARTRTAILLTNQTRQKIGISFGNPTTTPGGNAVKFAASARLQLMGGSAVKVEEMPVGKDVTIMCVKNKLVPPMRKAKARLLYETGWHEPWTTLTYAKNTGIVGAKAQGMKGYREALEKLNWPEPGGASFEEGAALDALSDSEARAELGGEAVADD